MNNMYSRSPCKQVEYQCFWDENSHIKSKFVRCGNGMRSILGGKNFSTSSTPPVNESSEEVIGGGGGSLFR